MDSAGTRFDAQTSNEAEGNASHVESSTKAIASQSSAQEEENSPDSSQSLAPTSVGHPDGALRLRKTETSAEGPAAIESRVALCRSTTLALLEGKGVPSSTPAPSGLTVNTTERNAVLSPSLSVLSASTTTRRSLLEASEHTLEGDWPLKRTEPQHESQQEASGTAESLPCIYQPQKESVVQPRRKSSGISRNAQDNAEVANDTKLSVEWYQFELHYGVSRNSVRDSLKEVLDDMVSHKSIHDWDRKFAITPFEQLKTALRSYLRQNESLNLNSLLTRTSVEEIVSIAGTHHRQPALNQGDNIDGHLLFTKGSSASGRRFLTQLKQMPTSSSTETMRRTKSARIMQGRVIFVEEQIVFIERAVLLILFSLYIRLQNEDPTFIYAFIERHLMLRSTFMSPLNWQLMSTPHGDSSRQKFYKRVTLSYHLVYLTFKSVSDSEVDAAVVDRILLSAPGKQPRRTPGLDILKASASVLLTIVIPEESDLRQEERELLRSPKGLWTVLVINCPLRLASNTLHEPSMQLNPVAQYVRGITYSVNTLRMNAEEIYDHLKIQLDASEDGSLFDDENFSKSELYHSIIKTCDTIRETLASNRRYLERVLTKQIKQLCEDAQDEERIGVETWKTRLEEELYLLEEFEAQVVALNAQVQESRNALHGVTAVLEARIALQQGHRLKIIGYLATIYLPLTASASVYSMSVLPSSATLSSFFVVLIVLLFLTVLLGLSFRPLLAKARALNWKKSQASAHHPQSRRGLFNMAKLVLRYAWAPFAVLISLPVFEKYVEMLTPAKTYPFIWNEVFRLPPEYSGSTKSWAFAWIYRVPYILFRYWPGRLVHHALTRELLFVRDQYRLYFLLGNKALGVQWYPLGLVRDVLRFFMLPVWLVLVIAIVGFIMVQDILLWLLSCICCGCIK